jgi:hypothetical protein
LFREIVYVLVLSYSIPLSAASCLIGVTSMGFSLGIQEEFLPGVLVSFGNLGRSRSPQAELWFFDIVLPAACAMDSRLRGIDCASKGFHSG